MYETLITAGVTPSMSKAIACARAAGATGFSTDAAKEWLRDHLVQMTLDFTGGYAHNADLDPDRALTAG